MASIEEAPLVQGEHAEGNRRFWEQKLAYCQDIALLAVFGAALAIPFLSTAAFVLAIATDMSLAFSAIVFCYHMNDGKFTAHVDPARLGTDTRAIKIGDDPLGQRIFDTIQKAPEGTVSTVDYKFPKPGTTEPVAKQSYVTRIGNEGCGVGYYK